MSDYVCKVFDTAGVLQFVVSDYSSLNYLSKVNAPGLLQVGLRGDHPLLASVADKWQIEVWRRLPGAAFARDFVGMVRQQEFYQSDRATTILTCPGLLSMLRWRHVLWFAGVGNRSQFTALPAETVAKTLVTYNATGSASVVEGRNRAGAITGLTVQADGATGETVDWFCSWANLLETLQELAQVGGGDFDLVKTGAAAWDFRWYDGQLGTDRSATVAFALQRGNMANPQYKELRMEEATVAVVGGQGEGSSRAVAVRTGADYGAGNDIEMFVNAADVTTIAGLQARGDTALIERQARREFTFDVLQTPACQYGEHYFLGDLVTAVNPFTGASVTLKVDQVRIQLDGMGGETIDVRMAAV